ncbi:MAG: HEAT repeat domain-containing protein [Gallionella sp.]|nr:HEAT repeat domain-containing protein [Gallionella sp.]
MDYATNSDQIIYFALITGFIAVGLAFLLVLQVIVLRFLLIRREQRKAKFLALWRPLMAQSATGESAIYPRVAEADIKEFLILWNHLQELIRGIAKDGLNKLAHSVGMNLTAKKLLRKGVFAEKVLAMMTLGNLRDKSAWASLTDLMHDESPLISLAASSSLMKIDAEAGIHLFMPLVVLREDWPPVKVAMILKEAGAGVISEPLANAIRSAKPKQVKRLINYLELASTAESSRVMREILSVSRDQQAIATCLRMMKDPRDLDMVRSQTVNPIWIVRVQAAAALGRIGVEEDKARLIRLLVDPQWWVRYRAATALSQLPFVSIEELRHIQTKQTDRFAIEMLQQVLAERVA